MNEQSFITYTPEQLGHILQMLTSCKLDAWIINVHTDEPILPKTSNKAAWSISRLEKSDSRVW